MGNIRDFVKVPKNASEALAYFVAQFPEYAVQILKLPKEQVDLMHSEVLPVALASVATIETAFREQADFLKKQFKKYGMAAMCAEAEHVQEAADKIHTADIHDIVEKLTVETARENILRDVVKKHIGVK